MKLLDNRSYSSYSRGDGFFLCYLDLAYLARAVYVWSAAELLAEAVPHRVDLDGVAVLRLEE